MTELLAALVNACDKGGASLLSLAVRYGYDQTVELLCDSGANVEACNTSVRVVVVSKNTAIDVGDRSSPIEMDGGRCTRLQAMGELAQLRYCWGTAPMSMRSSRLAGACDASFTALWLVPESVMASTLKR
jgi:hypothetical protein